MLYLGINRRQWYHCRERLTSLTRGLGNTVNIMTEYLSKIILLPWMPGSDVLMLGGHIRYIIGTGVLLSSTFNNINSPWLYQLYITCYMIFFCLILPVAPVPSCLICSHLPNTLDFLLCLWAIQWVRWGTSVQPSHITSDTSSTFP